MKRVQINTLDEFNAALNSGICCIERESARHIVNEAWFCFDEIGIPLFVAGTIAGDLRFEHFITLFIFDSPREAQQFLLFKKDAPPEDDILNAEIIE